jgi:HD superfamily phosphohydrolase
MAERVYRDPLHGSISFDRKTEEFVIELIDTREFQRLRRIRQLGAASLVFHGAEHSRFVHSIGVAFLAKKIFDRISTDPHFPADSDAEPSTGSHPSPSNYRCEPGRKNQHAGGVLSPRFAEQRTHQ